MKSNKAENKRPIELPVHHVRGGAPTYCHLSSDVKTPFLSCETLQINVKVAECKSTKRTVAGDIAELLDG